MKAEELPRLFDLLASFDDSPAYRARLDRFGISRVVPEFWPAYDWFQQRLLADGPVTAGLHDLNRYNSYAREDDSQEQPDWPARSLSPKVSDGDAAPAPGGNPRTGFSRCPIAPDVNPSKSLVYTDQ